VWNADTSSSVQSWDTNIATCSYVINIASQSANIQPSFTMSVATASNYTDSYIDLFVSQIGGNLTGMMYRSVANDRVSFSRKPFDSNQRLADLEEKLNRYQQEHKAVFCEADNKVEEVVDISQAQIEKLTLSKKKKLRWMIDDYVDIEEMKTPTPSIQPKGM